MTMVRQTRAALIAVTLVFAALTNSSTPPTSWSDVGWIYFNHERAAKFLGNSHADVLRLGKTIKGSPLIDSHPEIFSLNQTYIQARRGHLWEVRQILKRLAHNHFDLFLIAWPMDHHSGEPTRWN